MDTKSYSLLFVLIALLAGLGVAQAAPTEMEELGRELGIASVSMQIADPKGLRQLPVRIRTQPRCTFGDYEALLYDVLHSESRRAVVTLEPILPDERESVTEAVLIDDPEALLKSGFAAQFAIPAFDKPRLFGLYICKDSGESGQCRAKKMQPINEILQEYTKGPKALNSNPPDRVYFFGFVLIDGTKASVSRDLFAIDSRPKFKRYLSHFVGADPRFDETFDGLWTRIELLQPYPLGANDQGLVISLPRYDVAKCGHYTEKNPPKGDPGPGTPGPGKDGK